MNKKYSKIFLIMIIIVQLAVPVTLLVTKQIKRNNLKENGKDVKISVEAIYFDENCIYIESCELGAFDIDNGYKYAEFEEGQDGYFYGICTDVKSSDGAYLNIGYNSWSWSSVPYRNSGITEDSFGISDVGYYNVYNCYIETENINNGYIDGPVTEAYMIIRVYEGEFEIKDVYVDGVTLKEFVEKTQAGEIASERFEYYYDDYYWDDDYYDYEIEEMIDANE